MVTWLAEEVYRGMHARRLQRRVAVVVRDRDFLADRLAVGGDLPRHERVHRAALARLYPAPDATIVLDAPADLLFARKGELDLAELDLRRRGYRALGALLPRVSIVDATEPVDDVVERVVGIIRGELADESSPAGSRR
jgi:thymidylate kinase